MKIVGSVLVAGLLVAASPASAGQSAAEAAALRSLQSDLMIAALTCRADPASGLVASYNDFVTKYRRVMVESASVLKAHYRSAHGAGYEPKFDAFVTRIANDASMRQKRLGESCAQMADRFRPILALKDAQLVRFAAREYDSAQLLLASN